MEEPSLEALMQAGLIFVVGVAIILSNLLIIATYLNFRGKLPASSLHSSFQRHVLNVDFSRGAAERACSRRSSASVPFARTPFACTVRTPLSFSPSERWKPYITWLRAEQAVQVFSR